LNSSSQNLTNIVNIELSYGYLRGGKSKLLWDLDVRYRSLDYTTDTTTYPGDIQPCNELIEYEDIKEVKKIIEEIESKIEEKKSLERTEEFFMKDNTLSSNYLNICIDNLLGIYRHYRSNMGTIKGEIIKYLLPITDVAEKYGIDVFHLLNFVEAHEFAHAAMCPFLDKYPRKNPLRKNAAYLYIEEGFANAFALKSFENSIYFPHLLHFVLNQADHYRFGYTLFQKYNSWNELKDQIVRWKRYKLVENDDFQEYLKTL